MLHAGALHTLEERFARFGVPMTANNRQQALIPDGALLIANPVGTAPGFIVETERCAVIALPGVPREMKHLMTESVLPYLRARSGSEGIIRRRILRTFGIGESIIDERLTDLMNAANPTVGLAAHTGQVDIRIAARAESAAAAEALLDEVEGVVRARVGPVIYSSVPDETYETVLVRRLRDRSLTLAVYETNTQGALADRLSRAVPDFDPVRLRVGGGRGALVWDEAVAAEFESGPGGSCGPGGPGGRAPPHSHRRRRRPRPGGHRCGGRGRLRPTQRRDLARPRRRPGRYDDPDSLRRPGRLHHRAHLQPGPPQALGADGVEPC